MAKGRGEEEEEEEEEEEDHLLLARSLRCLLYAEE
jgi:hypothetical protein